MRKLAPTSSLPMTSYNSHLSRRRSRRRHALAVSRRRHHDIRAGVLVHTLRGHRRGERASMISRMVGCET